MRDIIIFELIETYGMGKFLYSTFKNYAFFAQYNIFFVSCEGCSGYLEHMHATVTLQEKFYCEESDF